MTQRRNLPSFRQYLLEDDEDIVSGLRKLASDIRSNWRSPYSSVRDEQHKHWKKLTPSQQQNLKRLFGDVVQGVLTNLNRPIPTNTFRPTSKREATVVPLTFYTLAKGAAEVGIGVVTSAETRGHITEQEAATFEKQYRGDGRSPADIPASRTLNDFVTAHRAKLATIISEYEDQGLAFDVSKVITTLINAVENKQTPADRRKQAVTDIHYLFLKMSHLLNEAGQQLEKKYAGANLPEEPPETPPGKPPGGTPPAA